MVFNPIGEYDKICGLHKLVRDIQEYAEIYGLDTNVESIKEEFNKCIEKWDNDYKEIVKYISNLLGKYVHIKFFYNSNYTEDRETNPSWTCDYEVNGLIYSFNQVNDCLCGVFNRLNDTYDSSFKDNCIVLPHFIETQRMEINEITEEDFLKQAQEQNFKVLKTRLDKISRIEQ